MGCDNGSFESGVMTVWSKKTTVDWVFHPAGPPVDSAPVKKIRVSFEMDRNSGACKIRPSIRMTNDGLTFDTPVPVGASTRNANGTTYATTFDDMTTTTTAKALVQPGIECINDSGSVLEMCAARLKFDFRD